MRSKYNTVAKMSNKIFELERDLRFTKETLQTTIEELQSNIEELQSTNEELQSTNEEIETSKEELQSLNEELVIANTELQLQIDQMATVNDDMNNLFISTEVAAIFLDNHLKIKLFTPRVEELINLLRTDIGRPLDHFATNLKYEGLIDDAKEVVRNLLPKSFEVQSKRNNWYLVRISPYRTGANVIDGVIITFNDITVQKNLEAKLEQTTNELLRLSYFSEKIFSNAVEPMLLLDINYKILAANNAFYQYFNYSPEQIINVNFFAIPDCKIEQAQFGNLLQQVADSDIVLSGYELECEINGKPSLIKLNARRVVYGMTGSAHFLISMEVINNPER